MRGGNDVKFYLMFYATVMTAIGLVMVAVCEIPLLYGIPLGLFLGWLAPLISAIPDVLVGRSSGRSLLWMLAWPIMLLLDNNESW